jgi:hypothetical protein
LFHFKTQDLNLDANSTEATLTGTSDGGQDIEGTDTVNIATQGKQHSKSGAADAGCAGLSLTSTALTFRRR